jgi:hypothetical protein
MDALPTVSMARARAAGRAPRVALICTCAVLTANGAVTMLQSPPVASPVPTPSRGPADTLAEQGLAERFAAAYLTLAPGEDGKREDRLRSLGLVESAGLADRVGRRPMRVTSTSVAAVRPVQGGANVTVAVAAGGAWNFLSVPVRRRPGGLVVDGVPAVVGEPPVAKDELGQPEDEVQSSQLKAMAGRVVRHYLAGARADLAADLAPRASVSIPRTDLRVANVDAITWADPGRRVAVALHARGRDGLNLTLRYELEVVRRGGRWLVIAVAGNPNQKEQSR